MTRKIKWKVVPRKGGGFWGTIVLPAGTATVPITARGATQREALANASGLASSLLDNPILKAALPPGSGAAIEAVKMLSKAVGAGKLKKAMNKLVGKGAKRVGKALKKLKFW
jgi:hypothetical protein